jgi:hypothetical protein
VTLKLLALALALALVEVEVEKTRGTHDSVLNMRRKNIEPFKI